MNCDLILPLETERLIPHRPPMLLVDRLLSCADGAGVVEACPRQDSLLVNSCGELDEVALVEMLAQGYATIKGYGDLVNGRPVMEGFLVGIRKLQIQGKAFAGDRLLIHIKTVGAFEDFAVVEGEVSCKDKVIAAGTFKLWIVNEGLVGRERR